jgi:iron-sulfur cluster assembly protein
MLAEAVALRVLAEERVRRVAIHRPDLIIAGVIELTPLAAEKLSGLMSQNPAQRVLRVYVAGQSCCGYQYGLALDEARLPDDAVVERGGIEVAVDPDSLPYVEGSTIDFVDALMGGGFTVRNPKLDSGGGCACGRR